jgi:hypothetical protein
MPCLFAMFAGLFPRFADILIWIARPTQFMKAFDDKWWWAVLGIIFLPFTTLMYLFLQYDLAGITGWDWLWLGLAVLLDLSHYVHTGYSNRAAIPGYTPPPAPPQPM